MSTVPIFSMKSVGWSFFLDEDLNIPLDTYNGIDMRSGTTRKIYIGAKKSLDALGYSETTSAVESSHREYYVSAVMSSGRKYVVILGGHRFNSENAGVVIKKLESFDIVKGEQIKTSSFFSLVGGINYSSVSGDSTMIVRKNSKKVRVDGIDFLESGRGKEYIEAYIKESTLDKRIVLNFAIQRHANAYILRIPDTISILYDHNARVLRVELFDRYSGETEEATVYFNPICLQEYEIDISNIDNMYTMKINGYVAYEKRIKFLPLNTLELEMDTSLVIAGATDGNYSTNTSRFSMYGKDNQSGVPRHISEAIFDGFHSNLGYKSNESDFTLNMSGESVSSVVYDDLSDRINLSIGKTPREIKITVSEGAFDSGRKLYPIAIFSEEVSNALQKDLGVQIVKHDIQKHT